MMLSENFTLEELIKSETALRLGIDNTPSPKHVENLRYLCVNILQVVRDNFCSPIISTSGYRCRELSIAIGSTAGSQHGQGRADDFRVLLVGNEEVALWIHDNLEYDQLILEYPDKDDKYAGWIHVSIMCDTENNRNEFLVAKRNSKGKTYYEHYKRSKL